MRLDVVNLLAAGGMLALAETPSRWEKSDGRSKAH